MSIFLGLTGLKKTFNKSVIALTLRNLRLSHPGFKHTPNHPWPGDFNRAHVLLDRYSSLMDHPQKHAWMDTNINQSTYFQSFLWMSDLRAIGDNQSRRFMRSYIVTWIKTHTFYNHLAWAPHVIGERLSQWLHHFEFFGQSADDDFLRIFYKSFYHQFTYLHVPALTLEPSYESITTLKGLILTALAYDLPVQKYAPYFQRLNKHLKHILLNDGFFHKSEIDPQLAILKHLIELRHFMRLCHQGQEAARLQHTITKMVPPLRFFRHGDGKLSSLSGISQYSSSMVDTVLALSDVKGRHPLRSEEAGFERLQVKNNSIILRTKYHNYPAQSSGNLQFEWSHGKDRLIKCCDIMLENQKGRPFQSRSMAHTYKHHDDDHAFIELKLHDMNHLHTRELYLTGDIDLRVCEKVRVNQRAFGSLRFIVDKNLEAQIATDGCSVVLFSEKNSRYRLHFSGIDEITVDHASFLGDEDLVIFALFELNANTPKEIKWSLTHH
ncbi:MAG: hypothetical protein K2X98_00100 [Alphaproteobacteria bacterium]|nr:hypothetical protein [Alphaproteobacteria bacterium]